MNTTTSSEATLFTLQWPSPTSTLPVVVSSVPSTTLVQSFLENETQIFQTDVPSTEATNLSSSARRKRRKPLPESLMYDPTILRDLVQRTTKLKLSDGVLALRRAAIEGDVRTVAALCSKGVDPDACDLGGWTALILAARYGMSDTVRRLLQCGADCNRATDMGWTALTYAAYNGHEEVIHVLLDHSHSLCLDHPTKTNGGWSALMYATYHEDKRIMEKLVFARPPAAVLHESEKGITALDCADWKDRSDLRKLLETAAVRHVREGIRESPLGAYLPEDLVRLLAEFVVHF